MRLLYFSRDYTTHDHRFLSALACTGHKIYYLRLEQSGHTLEHQRNYSAMPDERFFCMSCQLERPVSMRIKVMRRTRGGGLVPQYRCERCDYRKRPIKKT